MSLLAKLRKRQSERIATATVATTATPEQKKGISVATVASVAVANTPKPIAASLQVADVPLHWNQSPEQFHERAATREFDGGLHHSGFERMSEIDVQWQEFEFLLAIIAPAYKATPAEMEEMKVCARSDLENALVCYRGLANEVLA